MYATLFRWEIRALWRDATLWVAVGLYIAAASFALYNGWQWRGRLQEIGRAAERRESDARRHARTFAGRLDAGKESAPFLTRDPRNAYGFANGLMAEFAVLPPSPLAALTTGESDLLPNTLPIFPAVVPGSAGNSDPENPQRLLLGRFDAAFLIVFLFPLLIIALTYSMVAGERERGTLPLLLSQPVGMPSLVAARLLPRLILGSFALIVPAGVFVLLSSGDFAAGRLALWTAVGLLYSLFWLALSVFAISLNKSSAVNAIGLAATWLGLVILAPALINLTVKAVQPAPSRLELILALRDATDATTNERSKMLARYYEDHPEFLPPGGAAAAAEDYATLRQITTDRIERDLAPVLARYDAQLVRQQKLVDRLQFLSPALLAYAAFADAAGTDQFRHRDFVEQAGVYRTQLQAFFNPRILRQEKFSAWDEVPRFHYRELAPNSAWDAARPALIFLGVSGFIFFALGWFQLRRFAF